MTKTVSTTGRKIFFNISSFQILTMFRRGLFYSYLSIYLRFYLDLSVTETTLFSTLPMIFNVVFQNLVWGRVSDRWQLRRTMIIVGEVLAAVITFFVWYVHTLPASKHTAGFVIIIGLTVVEIFWSMSNLAWSALLSDFYPDKERAGMQGKMQSMGAAGRFIGVWIGGLLYDGLRTEFDGWGFAHGWLFFIACGAMLVSTIPMFFVPEGGVDSIPLGKGENRPDRPTIQNDAGDRISRQYLVFLLAVVFIFFGFNSVVMIKSQYLSLSDGFNVSSHTLSYIVNTTTVAIFISGLFIRRLSLRFKDEYLLMTGLIVGMVYLVTYSLSEKLALIYSAEFLGGVSMSFMTASSYAYASRLIPAHKRGKQFALYNGAMFLSWGVPGTFVAGPLVDHLLSKGMADTVSYRMAFAAASALMLVGAIVLFISIRLYRQKDVIQPPSSPAG